MTTTRGRRLVLGCAGVVAVAAVAVWLATTIPGSPRPEHGRAGAVPASDQARARAMRPAIDAYLDRDAGRLGFGGALSARLRPRVFCDATIIEVRPAKALSAAGFRPFVVSWHVGVVMNCGEFARRGHALLERPAGYPGIGEFITVLVLSLPLLPL